MSEPTTLVFDCDGVLYPNPNLLLDQFRANKAEFLDFLGFSEDKHHIVSTIGRNKGPGFVNFLCAAVEISNAEKAKRQQNILLVSDAEELWIEQLDYNFIAPNPAFAELLERFLRENINNKVVILTNNFKPHVFKVMKLLGFSQDLINQIEVLTPQRKKKEDTKAYYYVTKHVTDAFNRLKKYENVIFFDDNAGNAERAAASGLRVVHVDGTKGVFPILKDVLAVEK